MPAEANHPAGFGGFEGLLGSPQPVDSGLSEAKGVPAPPRDVLVMWIAVMTHQGEQGHRGPGEIRGDRDGHVVGAQGLHGKRRSHQGAEHHQVLSTRQCRAGNRERVRQLEVEPLLPQSPARAMVFADEVLGFQTERSSRVERHPIRIELETSDPQPLANLRALLGSLYPLSPKDLGPGRKRVERPVLNRAHERPVESTRPSVLVDPKGFVPAGNAKTNELQRGQVAALERDAAARLTSSFNRSECRSSRIGASPFSCGCGLSNQRTTPGPVNT
jgi:hypothetical protein